MRPVVPFLLHVILAVTVEGILLKNEDCQQCIAQLQHQVGLLQQRLEAMEQSKTCS